MEPNELIVCRELKGAVINAAQAAVVARILGIRVEL